MKMMLKNARSLFIIVSILVGFEIKAQTIHTPLFQIQTDTIEEQILESSYVEVLEDKEGKWTITDILKPSISDKFHKKGTTQTRIDTNVVHTYWHRYSLKNTMKVKAKIAFSSSNDYFDVFLFRANLPMAHFKTGIFVKPEEKDGFKIRGPGAIPIVLQPNEEVTIYDRRQRTGETNFKTTVRFYSTEKLIKKEYVDYVEEKIYLYGSWHLQESFILGLLLITFFLNLFFYRIVKEKVYLNFALFAFFLSINRWWNIAEDYTLWEYPKLYHLVPNFGYAWAFIPFFLIQFYRYFLGTTVSYPRLDKILFGLGVFNILLHLARLFSQLTFDTSFPYFYQISTLLFGVINCLLLVTLFIFVFSNKRPIQYLTIGSFPLLILHIISAYSEVKEIDIFSDYRLIEAVCISWLVLSVSLILMMRFENLRKENANQAFENERLAKEKVIERNELIALQKTELELQVEERTANLKQSLEDLKSTQSQLIQSEKMASLGELTAGIAHEIQNPLNFVNNFSEVSNELIIEVEEERAKNPESRDENQVSGILSDIKQNLIKINHHGKRAADIVKGMLQHSRTSSGVKEPTDINALADEYLRLAYHGLRAKDKSFNADFKTEFDESLPKINVIPQDIGRVLLNLINNGFYAVSIGKTATNEKTTNVETRHALSLQQTTQQPHSDSNPMVIVSTKYMASHVEIRVRDNGPGIPLEIKDKIFQPFFTTKPTGQGTGLGLSLSYDIVKAHGGELKVETKEGEGSEFIIQLPNNMSI